MEKALRQRLQAWEEELLHSGTRHNPARVEVLLHPEFREFGASGRVYDRAAIVRALTEEGDVELRMADFYAQELADGAVLVTYRTWRGEREREALRSSVWVRTGESWRMIFHQGTLVGSAAREVESAGVTSPQS